MLWLEAFLGGVSCEFTSGVTPSLPPTPAPERQADLPAWQGLRGTQNYQRSGTHSSPRPPFARNEDHLRPVSCYALFQWWLLLSQHPGCLRAPTSFYTELGLGTLADGLGCFPFDREAYPPQSHSLAWRTGIRSLVDFGNLVRPLDHP